MKNYIAYLIILLPSLIFSQQKTIDNIKTTKSKIVKIEDGDNTYHKKVKIITIKEQPMVATSDIGKLNEEQQVPTIKVQKTIIIDNDEDALYDEVTKFTYFKLDEDNDHALEVSDDQLINSFFEDSKFANKELEDNPYYIVTENDDEVIDMELPDDNTKLLINYFSATDKVIDTKVNNNSMF